MTVTTPDEVDAASFFGDDEDRFGPPRDRYGRPMLVPTAEYPGLSADQRLLAREGQLRVPYTRASSLASYIADFAALHAWQRRRLAYGLAQREDLCAMAASLPKFTNDRRKDRLTNSRLDEIIALAMEIGQVHEQANWGTATHGHTEPVETGKVHSVIRDDVASFWATMARAGVKILDTEVFCANDRLKSAGTIDHVLWVPGYGKVLADKKTGDQKPLEFGVQISSYRDGERYDWETDERTPWDHDLSADWAFVIDIRHGKGTTALRRLDLNEGRRMAALAAEVRDGHRASKDWLGEDVTDEIVAVAQRIASDLESAILECADREEVLALRSMRIHDWSAHLDEVAKTHLAN